MTAADTAKQIIVAMRGKGTTDATNTLYLAYRLENYAESRVVHLREMNRLLKDDHNELAEWMIKLGFATGHGDFTADLLIELEWQIKELRDV